jgi:hypothetical protein
MITSATVTSTDVAVPVTVFTSSTTGAPIAGAVTGQTNAITTMIFCNTGTVTVTDESVNTVNVSIYLVKNGDTAGSDNQIVSNLTIPAGETVFFSDEKIILDSGDTVQVGTNDATGSLITATVSTLPV